jgi:Integrase core domain
VYRIFDSAWTQRTDGVSSLPDEGFKLILGVLSLQVESKAGSRNPFSYGKDQCASPAGAETTAPQQYRSFSVCLAWFPSVLGAIAIVRPETIIRWHRAGFRAYWRWRSRNPVGRPKVPPELRTLIGEMSQANPHCRIDPASSGSHPAESGRPHRTIHHHAALGKSSRSTADFPTAGWNASVHHQLTAACGWEQIPRDLIRDRDACYGSLFVRRVRSLGIRDHPTSARSPWQNGYAERLIGSIRRECLDHIVVTGEQHLRHILKCYMEYYNTVRTHLSLGKDAPIWRDIQCAGRIEVRPVLGGLHHQYVRI